MPWVGIMKKLEVWINSRFVTEWGIALITSLHYQQEKKVFKCKELCSVCENSAWMTFQNQKGFSFKMDYIGLERWLSSQSTYWSSWQQTLFPSPTFIGSQCPSLQLRGSYTLNRASGLTSTYRHTDTQTNILN